MHFPFIHAEENTVININHGEDLLNNPPPFMNVRAIGKKDYDALDELRTQSSDPLKRVFS